MSAIDDFSSAATAAGASVQRVSRTAATETLKELTEQPAVGVPLEIEDVSLPDDLETAPDEQTLRAARTGITASPLGIESLGSVVIPSSDDGTGPISLFPERQIAVVERTNIVADVESAFARLAKRYQTGANDAVIVTGPSSTGDMGALVTGVHGPAELHIVVIDDE
ncbi:LUD domain-containing protein [Natronolimnobius sp. AArcel1]|uniref:LUD domain-containing protein n=1 Tax=Natronolimnobius sp. AArcel1 TaxID=1679093 RepID=UPI0013EC5970|nr:LUD domain-containing protein [Natronolimnobius sp. AArcel1]NGM67963.1 LUD domain-containing protein [Natronolimnobius sp. AArcel1]